MQTAADLAENLGASNPTILRRMKRLHSEGVKVVTMVDSMALGYKLPASRIKQPGWQSLSVILLSLIRGGMKYE